jgi:hypothetical protein
MSRWLDGISVRIRNRVYHYRLRTEPEAVGLRRAVTSAFADFCSSGGSPGAKIELSLVDPAQQFNAGDCDRCGLKPLEPQHWTDA